MLQTWGAALRCDHYIEKMQYVHSRMIFWIDIKWYIDEVFPNQFIEKIENLFSDFGKFPFYQLYVHTTH